MPSLKDFFAILVFLNVMFSCWGMGKLILPEFDTGTMHKYIIICDQRYGGTWLMTLLREQIDFRKNDETIHIEGELYRKSDAKPNLCRRIKEEFFESSKCTGRSICGFRVPYFVWQSCNFIRLAQKEQIHFIHVIRENKIDWLISHAVASELRNKMKAMNLTAAQVMHCKQGEKCYAEDISKVRIDPLDALQTMRNQSTLDQDISKSLEKANIRYRTLYYEDIMVMGTPLLLDFMGINVTETNQAATTRFQKRITKPQSEMISNYDEFVEVMRKTEFRWYLDACIKRIGRKDHC